MDILEFGEALGLKISTTKLGARFRNEKTFERDVIVKAAWEISLPNPEIRVFTHPWKRKAECQPTCEAAARNFSGRVEGCSACWKRSKERHSADVFGMRNNFDLAAVDRADGRLVVEVKWLQFKGNKAPNSEFQRFVGQCALAAAANRVVIGVCGLWGRREKPLDKNERLFGEALAKVGVRLIVLRGS
ncbi:MAG TPA: hypothetical protein VFO58_19795 [Vicinamibacterales bacterium]|nr:hypothetical protein [Vicinamibacterales bacterium]